MAWFEGRFGWPALGSIHVHTIPWPPLARLLSSHQHVCGVGLRVKPRGCGRCASLLRRSNVLRRSRTCWFDARCASLGRTSPPPGVRIPHEPNDACRGTPSPTVRILCVRRLRVRPSSTGFDRVRSDGRSGSIGRWVPFHPSVKPGFVWVRTWQRRLGDVFSDEAKHLCNEGGAWDPPPHRVWIAHPRGRDRSVRGGGGGTQDETGCICWRGERSGKIHPTWTRRWGWRIARVRRRWPSGERQARENPVRAQEAGG